MRLSTVLLKTIRMDWEIRDASRRLRTSQPFRLQLRAMQTNRRGFLKHAIVSIATCASLHRSSVWAQSSRNTVGQLETFVPTRAITRGPLFHWFGYYDKHEFDPSNRFVLANQVVFEGRSPTANDRIQVGYVDLEQNDRWTEIGSSSAWGWQQGCMLQWVGKTGRQIMWNDRQATVLSVTCMTSTQT